MVIVYDDETWVRWLYYHCANLLERLFLFNLWWCLTRIWPVHFLIMIRRRGRRSAPVSSNAFSLSLLFSSCGPSNSGEMVSRRKILSRSRDDLNLDGPMPGEGQPPDEEDVWYQKEKLYKVRLRRFDIILFCFMWRQNLIIFQCSNNKRHVFYPWFQNWNQLGCNLCPKLVINQLLERQLWHFVDQTHVVVAACMLFTIVLFAL